MADIRMGWGKDLVGVSSLPDGTYNLKVVNGVGVASPAVTPIADGVITIAVGDAIGIEEGIIISHTPA